MTVRFSRDDGKTWSASKLVDPNFSAYSCLEALGDNSAGLPYEGAVSGRSYGRITFLRFGLDWLTDTGT